MPKSSLTKKDRKPKKVKSAHRIESEHEIPVEVDPEKKLVDDVLEEYKIPPDSPIDPALEMCQNITKGILNNVTALCTERFVHRNSVNLIVTDLRNAWLRLAETEWLDGDVSKADEIDSDILLKPDDPPLPMAFDTWSRGALEFAPDSRRESIMDPFIRDIVTPAFLAGLGGGDASEYGLLSKPSTLIEDGKLKESKTKKKSKRKGSKKKGKKSKSKSKSPKKKGKAKSKPKSKSPKVKSKSKSKSPSKGKAKSKSKSPKKKKKGKSSKLYGFGEGEGEFGSEDETGMYGFDEEEGEGEEEYCGELEVDYDSNFELKLAFPFSCALPPRVSQANLDISTLYGPKTADDFDDEGILSPSISEEYKELGLPTWKPEDCGGPDKLGVFKGIDETSSGVLTNLGVTPSEYIKTLIAKQQEKHRALTEENRKSTGGELQIQAQGSKENLLEVNQELEVKPKPKKKTHRHCRPVDRVMDAVQKLSLEVYADIEPVNPAPAAPETLPPKTESEEKLEIRKNKIDEELRARGLGSGFMARFWAARDPANMDDDMHELLSRSEARLLREKSNQGFLKAPAVIRNPDSSPTPPPPTRAKSKSKWKNKKGADKPKYYLTKTEYPDAPPRPKSESPEMSVSEILRLFEEEEEKMR